MVRGKLGQGSPFGESYVSKSPPQGNIKEEAFKRPCKEWLGATYQSVTFVKILPQTNIRIYSYQVNYTNECPNIFVSKI